MEKPLQWFSRGVELIGAGAPVLAQMFFWITGGVIAILTYRSAKRSILQPAKTEVFKLQVAKLQSLLDALNWSDEYEAWVGAGLEEALLLNTFELWDLYALSVGLPRTEASRRSKPPKMSSLISEKAAEKVFELIVPGDRQPDPSRTQAKPNWSEYAHHAVHIGPVLTRTFETISAFQSDPVVPSFVSQELQKLRADLVTAAADIGKTMDKAAKFIPEHYPTTEAFEGATWEWVANLHPSEKRYAFFTRLSALRAQIRSYLQSDQMFDL